MTWAILGLGAFLIVVLAWCVVQIALRVLQSSQSTAAILVSLDQRAHAERKEHREQMMGLIDRFLSGDWEAVRLHEGTKDTQWGGFMDPRDQAEEEKDVVSEIPRPGDDTTDEEDAFVEQEAGLWGRATRTQDRADALDEAAQLAQEDDLDSMDADRARRLEQARERGLVT